MNVKFNETLGSASAAPSIPIRIFSVRFFLVFETEYFSHDPHHQMQLSVIPVSLLFGVVLTLSRGYSRCDLRQIWQRQLNDTTCWWGNKNWEMWKGYKLDNNENDVHTIHKITRSTLTVDWAPHGSLSAHAYAVKSPWVKIVPKGVASVLNPSSAPSETVIICGMTATKDWFVIHSRKLVSSNLAGHYSVVDIYSS